MTYRMLTNQNTPFWVLFTVASFILAALMMAGGIYFMEASFAAKGFYAMASIMLVHTSITITKTLRDGEEAEKLTSKLDEAKTQRLLRDIDDEDVI